MNRKKQIEKFLGAQNIEDEISSGDFEEDNFYNGEDEKNKIKEKYSISNKQTKNFDAAQEQLKKYKAKKIDYKSNILDNNSQDEEIEEEEEENDNLENFSDDEEIEIDSESKLESEEVSVNSQEDEDFNNHDNRDIVTSKNNKQNKINNEPKKNITYEDSKANLDKEDEEYLKTITMASSNDIRKGKNVVAQKLLFEFFIGLRISLHKILTNINLFPQGKSLQEHLDKENIENFKLFCKDLIKLLSSFIQVQREMIGQGNLRENLSKLCNGDINNEYSQIDKILQAFALNLDSDNNKSILDIFNIVNKLNERIMLISEKIFDIWYRKTLIYSYKSNSKLNKILNNNFTEHLKKNVESNYQNFKQKTNKKITNEKVFGKNSSSIANENDKQIYNDTDFYNYLLKEFISNKEDNFEEEMGQGNRFDLTLQYLMNRNKNKKENKVDRRASKNRKLRFDKHEKLINFMVPITNNFINTGRDEIVKSIFGIKRRRATDVIESNDIDII